MSALVSVMISPSRVTARSSTIRSASRSCSSRHSCRARRRCRRECRDRTRVHRFRPRPPRSRPSRPGTAVPTRTRCPSRISIAPNPLAGSRITTPSRPPSRIRRFEPRPTTVTLISRGRCLRKNARSASSTGRKNSCAGPPTRSVVISASSWFGISCPRTSPIHGCRLGMRSGHSRHGRSGSLPISAPSSPGSAAAHCVMLPAPRQTT